MRRSQPVATDAQVRTITYLLIGFVLWWGMQGGTLSWLPTAVLAAEPAIGLLDLRQLAQVGVERQWFTRAATTARTPGKIEWTVSVSATSGKTVFDVRFPGGIAQYTDRDVDRRGNRLGVQGARRRAELHAERLRLQGLTPEITEHQVPDIHLFVMTPAGSLQCFDAESGGQLWVAQIGPAGHPVYPPAVSQQYVGVVYGTHIVLLDRFTGQVIWSKRSEGVPGAGAAISRTLLFAPMHDGTLEIYSVQDVQQPMKVYRALGHPTAQPLITPLTVAWPTDKGHLYVAAAEDRQILYRVEAARTIEAAPAYQNGQNGTFFVPSADGYIYCVHERTGSIVWTFSTGEPLTQTPYLHGDSVYFVSAQANLYHIGASTPDLRWIVPGISQLLAIGGERLYCASRTGQLVVLDKNSGSRLYQTISPLPSVRMANLATDRIYVCNDDGLMECLRPVGAAYPAIYVDLSESGDKTQEKPGQEKSPAPAAPDMPMGTTPPAEEPFAPPAAPGATRPGEAAGDPFAPTRP